MLRTSLLNKMYNSNKTWVINKIQIFLNPKVLKYKNFQLLLTTLFACILYEDESMFKLNFIKNFFARQKSIRVQSTLEDPRSQML